MLTVVWSGYAAKRVRGFGDMKHGPVVRIGVIKANVPIPITTQWITAVKTATYLKSK